MLRRRKGQNKQPGAVVFAAPPWDESSPEWQAIDRRLGVQHLAREIAQAVEQLDLSGLEGTDQGRGSQPVRAELLVKMILYELQMGKPAPAEWFYDSRDSDTLKWLGFGIQPARATFYAFRERVVPYWEAWNAQVLEQAIEAGYTAAKRGAQDGTTIAAAASRHKLVTQPTLEKRLGELDAALTADHAGQPPSAPPAWMAKQPSPRAQQRERYQQAWERMEQLQVANQQRRSCKRQAPEKIVVSVSDPEAAYGYDKLKTFRPLSNGQFIRDWDSPFILSYDVFNHATDTGTLEPMVARMLRVTGRKLETLLADAAYATLADLEVCAQHAITLYAPVGENDYTTKNHRKPATNQFTQLPKTAFTWLEDRQTYRCPQGHLLHYEHRSRVPRAGGQQRACLRLRCLPAQCGACPRRQACPPNPETGRTVSRLEHEELLDALRARMETREAKTLYRLRAQTVELAFAELKEHRSLRRLTARGLQHAKAQVAAFVLSHNLLTFFRMAKGQKEASSSTRILDKMAA